MFTLNFEDGGEEPTDAPGTAVWRVTGAVFAAAEPGEAAQGLRGACAALAGLPAVLAHLGRWGGPRGPPFSGFADSE